MINPVQSARLRTTGSFTFKYGRFEVSSGACIMRASITSKGANTLITLLLSQLQAVAKLPKGDW